MCISRDGIVELYITQQEELAFGCNKILVFI